MRPSQLLVLMMQYAATHSLRQVDERLEQDPHAVAIIPCDGQRSVSVGGALARRLVARELQARQHWSASDELRQCAGSIPQPADDGQLNLASWVGARTPLWHTVFSYSSPESVALVPPADEAHWPWFSQLEPVAQRDVLLLVAAIEETNSDS